jgi:hypothetical protein
VIKVIGNEKVKNYTLYLKYTQKTKQKPCDELNNYKHKKLNLLNNENGRK